VAQRLEIVDERASGRKLAVKVLAKCSDRDVYDDHRQDSRNHFLRESLNQFLSDTSHAGGHIHDQHNEGNGRDQLKQLLNKPRVHVFLQLDPTVEMHRVRYKNPEACFAFLMTNSTRIIAQNELLVNTTNSLLRGLCSPKNLLPKPKVASGR